MKAFNRMLIRDLKIHWWQLAAIAVVVMFGIVSFLSMYVSYRNLKNSTEFYYQEYNFLDYYAEVLSIPASALTSLKNIDGVEKVMGRVTKEARVELSGDIDVPVKVNSLPIGGNVEINKLYYFAGRYPEKGKRECLVSSTLADFYKLQLGDKLNLIAAGQRIELKICGIASSPEYIYEIPSAGSLFVQPGDYGVLFIDEELAQTIFGFPASYNQVHFLLEKNYKEDVITNIEEKLDKYTFVYGMKRKDQISASMIDSEISQLENYGFMFPFMFLGISSIMLYLMMRRKVQGHRTSIGTLKALGYSTKDVERYYLKMAFLVGLLGAVPGTILGNILGVYLNEYYTLYFNIPVMQVRTYWNIVGIGLAAGVGVTLLATKMAVRRTVKISPADAMRPDSPETYKGFNLTFTKPVWDKFPFGWKMSIRNLFRKKGRTFMTGLGVAFTVMMFMVSMFLLDTSESLIARQFTESEIYDLKVVFAQPVSLEDVAALKRIEGVNFVEPIVEIGAKIKTGLETKDIIIQGIKPNTKLIHIWDINGKPLKIPDDGVILNYTEANKLGIKPGDTINVELFGKEKIDKRVKVKGVGVQFMGFSTYSNISYLSRLMDDTYYASGALISAAEEDFDSIEQELTDMPIVQSAVNRNELIDWLFSMMGFAYIYVGVLMAISGFIGFAIIFNTSIINLQERTRELASLRVLGYTVDEVKRLVNRENMIIGLASLIPGMIMGYWTSVYFNTQFVSDFYFFHIIILPRTYIITLGATISFILLAGLTVKKRIKNLDMVEVLKEREG